MSLLRVFAIPNNHIICKGVLGESIFKACARTAGSAADGKTLNKEPLRKAKTPLGRFDISEKETTKDVLERFPEDVNPGTKEKGGPKGPEPTRFDLNIRCENYATIEEIRKEQNLTALYMYNNA